jgi:predicted amidohydrolase YtcJ
LRRRAPSATAGVENDGLAAGSAFAAFDDRDLGRLEPGYLADLIVLSEDILVIDPKRIGDVKVDFTIVGGKVVFER